MKGAMFAIMAVVLLVAMIAVVNLNKGAAGNLIVSGPVCCAASPYSQSSYGAFQGQSLVRTITCDPGRSIQACCIYEMANIFDGPVKLDGAHEGPCGVQRFP